MPQFNLLKSVSTPENISESGALRKLLGLKTATPPAAAPQQKAVDLSARSNMSAEVNLLERFVGEVKSAEAGKERVVFSLPIAQFTNFISGEKSSGKAYIKEVRKEKDGMLIKSMAMHFANPKIHDPSFEGAVSLYRLKKGYTFSKMAKLADSELMLLMDVPVGLCKALEEYGHTLSDKTTALDLVQDLIAKSTDVLEKMLHHAYYVMTLKTAASRKIMSEVDAAWGDIDELKAVLNPKIVYHYRSRSELDVIKSEFEDIQDQKKSPEEDEFSRRDQEDDLPSSRRKPGAVEIPSGPRDPKAEETLIATKLNAMKSAATGLSSEDQRALSDSIRKVLNFMNNGTLEDD